jgi:hypothetical protein
MRRFFRTSLYVLGLLDIKYSIIFLMPGILAFRNVEGGCSSSVFALVLTPHTCGLEAGAELADYQAVKLSAKRLTECLAGRKRKPTIGNRFIGTIYLETVGRTGMRRHQQLSQIVNTSDYIR